MLNNYLSPACTNEISERLRQKLDLMGQKEKKIENILIKELMIIKRFETCTILSLLEQSMYIQAQDY